MTCLVTGAAGFIGSNVVGRLLDQGDEVVGVDNLNAYYDPALKQARLARLQGRDGFAFAKSDIEDRAALERLFAEHQIKRVIHLAAQAGVRYSIENPRAYIDSNIVGFQNVIDLARDAEVKHFVYASTSSVYGANTKMPFSVGDNVDHPVSLYAATKKCNELVAHTYAHLFQLPVSGLRFFTVYGPWGRPDMSMFLFTRKILNGEPIEVFNNGDHLRDFTYVDDIAEGVVRVLDQPAAPNPSWSGNNPDPATSLAPYRLYNIGNNNPVRLMDYIEAIEEACGKKAEKVFLPLQQGDVPATYANIDHLSEAVGFVPKTPLDVGVRNFVAWYKSFYG